jgi:GMP synthase-like glutamine amidotransferase
MRKCLKTLQLDYIETNKIDYNLLHKYQDKIKGIIISGSSMVLSQPNLFETYSHIFFYLSKLPTLPIFGICFGSQLLALMHGLSLEHQGEYNRENIMVKVSNDRLFTNVPPGFSPYFYFSDLIVGKSLKHVKEIAWFNYNNKKTPCAFDFGNNKYGVLFHPEHDENTYFMIYNFAKMICGI